MFLLYVHSERKIGWLILYVVKCPFYIFLFHLRRHIGGKELHNFGICLAPMDFEQRGIVIVLITRALTRGQELL